MVAVGSDYRNRSELRKKPRRAFRYNAKILTDRKGTMLACSISDISESGARIVLESDTPLPERVVLLLTPSGDARRHCRVIWRDGTTVGVEFPNPHP